MSEFRIEHDIVGEQAVPKQAYYGVHSLRAQENFSITGRPIHAQFIRSLAFVKKACAMTNMKVHEVDEGIAQAIVQACEEIIDGQLHDQFIVDAIQGGAGTSMNMNANEVIANRALELIGHEKGDYAKISPLDHVNFGQSTNDVIPTAGKLTCIILAEHLLEALQELKAAFDRKAYDFEDIIKMGRTQLQDAVPIRLGQEFAAYAHVIKRDIERIKWAQGQLSYVNLGGTAIGTGLNANIRYFKKVVPTLAMITGFELKQSADVIDGTQNLDAFSTLSGALKTCCLDLSKISNDLRLMSSGPRTGLGEINLPPRQNGSSIMPGKVNPVIPEVVNQVAFYVIGNDVTVSMGVEAGQLELNAFEPVIFNALFESLDAMRGAVDTFTRNCVEGITANREVCQSYVDHSVGVITALSPYVGYENAVRVAKQAIRTGEPVRRLILDSGLMDEARLDVILKPFGMTTPGISGELVIDEDEDS